MGFLGKYETSGARMTDYTFHWLYSTNASMSSACKKSCIGKKEITMHKKWSFPLCISSVNATKPADVSSKEIWRNTSLVSFWN